MKLATQICSMEDLQPRLYGLLSPLISSREGIFVCQQTTYYQEAESAYHAFIITQMRICYAYQDFPSGVIPRNTSGGQIALGEVSGIFQRFTDKERIPQLVILGRDRDEFTRVEFSSLDARETIIRVLSNLGLTINSE